MECIMKAMEYSIDKNDVEKTTLKEFNDVFEKYADEISEKLIFCFENGLSDVMMENERCARIFNKDGYSIEVAPKGFFVPFGTLLKLMEELQGNVTIWEGYNALELHLETPDENKSVFTALVIPKYNRTLFEGRKLVDIMIVTMENGLGFEDSALESDDDDFIKGRL